MRKIIYVLSVFLALGMLAGCEEPESNVIISKPGTGGESGGETEKPEPPADAEPYDDIYDQVADKGQYWMPSWDLSVKENIPTRYFCCVDIANHGAKNSITETDHKYGLQAHLLAQSVAGLVNANVSKTFQTAVWQEKAGAAYEKALQYLHGQGITEFGRCNAIELTQKTELQPVINQYILVDVKSNPESGVYAAVASPHLNAYIVDVRDVDVINKDHKMVLDARNKSTQDAWDEYKDKVNRKGLVVMPVQTGELRDWAIMNKFFVINLNKVQGDPNKGQNAGLLREVLASLEPNSPVFGWESGVAEDVFVEQVSNYGHMMVPCDWFYNATLTSYNYKERQTSVLAKVKNPTELNFNLSSIDRYVAFYLSDGDNVQWMMNDFDNEKYYNHPDANETRMGFGMPFPNLSMMAPSQFEYLVNKQGEQNTLVETFGGGYYYADGFGSAANRSECLKKLAANLASHMRQHRVKILGLMAMDARSDVAKEAYAEYIAANDQLEGIVVIQYAPYAGGEGEIMWFRNSKGYNIPVVTAKYAIWDHGTGNSGRQGTPAYVANLINTEDIANTNPFSLVSVHAWSNFADIGESDDQGAEAAADGDVVGPGAAKQCKKRLNENVRVVNVQELIWRVRMFYEPEETQEILSKLY